MAEAAKAARAAEADTTFVENVKSYQSRLMDENEQSAIRAAIDAGERYVVRATPDILFAAPTIIGGSCCTWIEWKNTLGLRDSPIVHRKHREQLQRYINIFGPGMVVYKLGFECNLMQIKGLSMQREADVAEWLRSQNTM